MHQKIATAYKLEHSGKQIIISLDTWGQGTSYLLKLGFLDLHALYECFGTREPQYSAFLLELWFSLLKWATSKPVIFFDMDCFSLDFHMYPHS